MNDPIINEWSTIHPDAWRSITATGRFQPGPKTWFMNQVMLSTAAHPAQSPGILPDFDFSEAERRVLSRQIRPKGKSWAKWYHLLYSQLQTPSLDEELLEACRWAVRDGV